MLQLTEAEQNAFDYGHDGGHAILLANVVRRLLARVRLLEHELDCHFCLIGGCDCDEYNRLKEAADAAEKGQDNG